MNIDENNTKVQNTQIIKNRLLKSITDLCAQAEKELEDLHKEEKHE